MAVMHAGHACGPCVLLATLRHLLRRRLESDLRMGAVAERLLARRAAAAQKHRRLRHVYLPVFVIELDRSLDLVGPVLLRRDLHISHGGSFAWAMTIALASASILD